MKEVIIMPVAYVSSNSLSSFMKLNPMKDKSFKSMSMEVELIVQLESSEEMLWFDVLGLVKL